MPRKKKGKGKTIAIVVILLVIGLGVVAWHDGLIGATSIADINAGNVNTGTYVTVKGELTGRLGNVHTISPINGNGGLVFIWDGESPAVGSIIVVRGKVNSVFTLNEVSSVVTVWIFK